MNIQYMNRSQNITSFRNLLFVDKLVWLNMDLADNEVFIKFWHHTLNADASRCDQIDQSTPLKSNDLAILSPECN